MSYIGGEAARLDVLPRPLAAHCKGLGADTCSVQCLSATPRCSGRLRVSGRPVASQRPAMPVVLQREQPRGPAVHAARAA